MQQNLPDQQINATGAKNSNDEKQRREDVTNYEVSSKTITTVSDGYAVNKMFLAVLVNRPRLAASLGDKASDAAIEAKVAEIAQLAATAAGHRSSARGPDPGLGGGFHGRCARPDAGPRVTFTEVMMRQSGSFVSALTILAVAGMLIWFGLRPAINTILAGSRSGESAQLLTADGAGLLGDEGSAAGRLSARKRQTSCRTYRETYSMRPRSGWSRLSSSMRSRQLRFSSNGSGRRSQYERGTGSALADRL